MSGDDGALKFSHVEEVMPYKNTCFYSLYRFDCEVMLGDRESHICDVKVIALEPEEALKARGLEIGREIWAIVNNVNTEAAGDKAKLAADIIEFVKTETAGIEENDQIRVAFE